MNGARAGRLKMTCRRCQLLHLGCYSLEESPAIFVTNFSTFNCNRRAIRIDELNLKLREMAARCRDYLNYQICSYCCSLFRTLPYSALWLLGRWSEVRTGMLECWNSKWFVPTFYPGLFYFYKIRHVRLTKRTRSTRCDEDLHEINSG